MLTKRKISCPVILLSSTLISGLCFLGSTVHATEEITANQMLLEAANNNDLTRLQQAIENSADLNVTDAVSGTTALIWATEAGHQNIINALIQAGADPNRADKSGGTALLVAVSKFDIDTINALLRAGADPNMADRRGNTALVWAARQGKTNIVQMLLAYGAIPPKDQALEGLPPHAKQLIRNNKYLYDQYLQASKEFVNQEGRMPPDLTRLIIKDFAGHSE